MGMFDNLTPQQQQLMASVAGTFAGVQGAQLYGDDNAIQPGRGRMRLGRAEVKQTSHGHKFFNEATIVWFRGGVAHDGSRVSDAALREGDPVSIKIPLNSIVRAMLFKNWTLAVSKAWHMKEGGDPDQIVEASITDQHAQAIYVAQLQEGLEVDFVGTAKVTKEGGHQYVRIMLDGGQPSAIPPMTAAPAALPAPVAVAPAAPALPLPAPVTIDVTPPGLAPAFPPQVQTAWPPAAVAPPSPFPPPVAVAAPSPFPPPVAGAMTRDQKLAAIVAKNPHLAGADLSSVSDAQLDLYL